MRRLIAFDCEADTLAATLDEAVGTTGLLIVSGGNEIRVGAHRGMALLADSLCRSRVPVFRFDRRGIGDSTGTNDGWSSSASDIVAAVAAFRAEQPQLRRIVGFGNCDAASALALFGRDAGIDAVMLANPWVIETDGLPPTAAIRRRYAERLRDFRQWRRLLAGGVDIRKFFKGLRKLSKREAQQLADRVIAAIAAWRADARIVLAEGDATAIAFADAAATRDLPTSTTVIATASHSFARAGDAAALEAEIRRALS